MSTVGMQRPGCVPAAVSLSAVLGQQDALGVGGQRGTELTGIGDYVFDRTVGEGQFGKVKVATHKLSGMRVAIKIINKLKLTAETIRMVHREVAIMKMLRHPNIIRLYEVIDTPALLFLVMEYAPGGEVMDLIAAHGRLRECDAVRFFAQTAYALAYCHSRRTVHRDVKAENLLLDAQMNVKLIDFGLSNVYDPRDVLKTFCGSPTYASPELVQRRAYTGPEVDCWSLGVLLYVLVVGELPFLGKSYLELYRKIIAARYWMPAYLSPDCQDLIRHMLVPDIKSRATITEICNHPWVRAGGVSIPRQNFGLAPPLPDAADLDPAVLDHMEEMGFDRQAVVDSVVGDLYDDAAATYCLLASNARGRAAARAAFGDTASARSDDSPLARTPRTPPLAEPAAPATTVFCTGEKQAPEGAQGGNGPHTHGHAHTHGSGHGSGHGHGNGHGQGQGRGLSPAAAAFAAHTNTAAATTTGATTTSSHPGVPTITRISAGGDEPQLPQEGRGKGSTTPRDGARESSSGSETHEGTATTGTTGTTTAEEKEAQRRQRKRKRTSLCVVEPLTGTPGTPGPGKGVESPAREADAALGSAASSPGKKGARAHRDSKSSRSSSSRSSSGSGSSGHRAAPMKKSSSAGVLSTKRRPLATPESDRSETQDASPRAVLPARPTTGAHAPSRQHSGHHHHHHHRAHGHHHGDDDDGSAPAERHARHTRRHHTSRAPSQSPEKAPPGRSSSTDDDAAVRLPVAATAPVPVPARAESDSDTSSSSSSGPGSGRAESLPTPQRRTRLGMLVNWRRTVAESQPEGGPQTPRPVRFAFSVSTTTTLPAAAVLDALRGALRRHSELAVTSEKAFVLRCTECAPAAAPAADGNNSSSDEEEEEEGADGGALVMEVEVCQLPLLSQNGVRFRRIAGDAARYKALCKELIAVLEPRSAS